MTPRPLQPTLHTLVSTVAAPGLTLSERDGQIGGEGACGWFVDDVRLLKRLVLNVEGSDLVLVGAGVTRGRRSEFRYVARGVGDSQADPTVFVDRVRTLTAACLVEEMVFSSRASRPVDLTVHLDLGSDLASISSIRNGDRIAEVRPHTTDGGLAWSGDGVGARVDASPPPDHHGGPGVLTWQARLDIGDSFRLRLECRPSLRRESQFPAGAPAPWAPLRVEATDHRVERLLQRGLADLEGLLLCDGTTGDRFLAAGSPWFFTLFGRDSLWAARMLLPLGTDLALSTLRSLARRQGGHYDARTEEEPGKIPHEVRSGETKLDGLSLPPLYYGTVDATPLFVVTLAEAWRWGADPAQVEALLPAVRRCLDWTMEQSLASGWLQYVDSSGTGLTNQGWKDSVDSVQFADGRLAEAPIALSEVQAYAFQAAVEGARLLDAFGQPEVEGLAAWAEDLRDRFHHRFWVSDDAGDYPAIALDRSGVPVDSRSSNMGHLLGTGLLGRAQARAVAAALAAPDMDSGFGLRTLTAASPRFSRLSYHGGSVWPHDTAIAATGLSLEGFRSGATALALGLVRAAEAFDYRLPELYGGDALADVPSPSAYPAACRPQAWAAAAPLAALMAVAGVRVDVPAGTIRHPAYTTSHFGALTLRELLVGTARLDIDIASDGRVTVSTDSDLAIMIDEEFAGTPK